MPCRPLVFIVHSLGGILLKEVLRRAWQARSYELGGYADVFQSTKGIIFMGTPHRGSDYAPWAITLRGIASAIGFDASDKILRDLRADSGILELLRTDFGQMLREESFQVWSFVEGLGLKGAWGLNKKVITVLSIHVPEI